MQEDFSERPRYQLSASGATLLLHAAIAEVCKFPPENCMRFVNAVSAGDRMLKQHHVAKGKIIRRLMHDALAMTLPRSALEMALRHRQPTAGLAHHSDRGGQWASTANFERIEILDNRERRQGYLGYKSPVDFENNSTGEPISQCTQA